MTIGFVCSDIAGNAVVKEVNGSDINSFSLTHRVLNPIDWFLGMMERFPLIHRFVEFLTIPVD